jgi:KUP system potassium uptake protein
MVGACDRVSDRPFLVIDLSFLSANMLKVVEGGWMPLALGSA